MPCALTWRQPRCAEVPCTEAQFARAQRAFIPEAIGDGEGLLALRYAALESSSRTAIVAVSAGFIQPMKQEWRCAASTTRGPNGKLRAMSRAHRHSVVLLGVGLVPFACSGDLVPPEPEHLTADVGAADADSQSTSSNSTTAAESESSMADQPEPEPEPTSGGTDVSAPPSTPAAGQPPPGMSTMFQAESLELSGQYADSISSPFSGVALYANGDSVSIEHTFPVVPGTYRVDVTGASSNNLAATAELLLGNRSLGNLAFRGTSSSVQTVEFSIHASPTTRTLNLRAINDNDSWDLFIDEIELTFVSSDTE